MNLVIQAARLADGSRKITHISEVVELNVERQRYVIFDLFVRELSPAEDGSVESELVASGNLPTFSAQLFERGLCHE